MKVSKKLNKELKKYCSSKTKKAIDKKYLKPAYKLLKKKLPFCKKISALKKYSKKLVSLKNKIS